MDIRERILELGGTESFEEILRAAVSGEMRDMWTVLPAKVTKDSDGKKAMLLPTVKAQVRDADGKVQHMDLPEVEGIVHHMGGGGNTQTVPIKTDNEGTILFASRAVDAWHQSGGSQQAVDTRSHHLSDGIFLPGVRSQPRDLKDISTEATENRSDDGKHRAILHPTNGLKQSVNDGKQILDINAKTGGMEVVSKTVVMASGEAQAGRAPHSENTQDKDLNDIIKGLSARVTQVEKTSHGLFDVTSQFRAIVQQFIPQVAAVAPILNQQPGGLDAMVGAIEGKAQAYLQTQMMQALGMFKNPTLGNVTSLLGGGIEGQIQALTAQVAQLASQNPAAAAVESLTRQADAVLTRGAAPDVQAAQLQPIRDEISRLTADNPVVGLVQGLRKQIDDFVSKAGAGLDFMGPQKRAAQGVVKSLRLSQG